jgi:hypothetical protein
MGIILPLSIEFRPDAELGAPELFVYFFGLSVYVDSQKFSIFETVLGKSYLNA